MRRFGLGSGPLKRRSDRIQVVGRVVVVLSVLGSPPLAVAAATATGSHLDEVAAAEAASRTRATAVLLAEAPPPRSVGGAGDFGQADPRPPRVPAVWTDRDGRERRGDVVAAPGAPAGSPVHVWLDAGGEPARAPRDPATIPVTAAAVGASTLLVVPLGAGACYVVLCAGLDRYRDRRWAREWASVGPGWTSRSL
ncbi:hypothetical protein [Blastococcus litoris]|uniref:Rv1733c family protein n=1 Tax=Blastococcus litoris TaxID=2171622 RepID=UPI000E307853|nr:hypothetical protein [Blastococcus litoris]